MQMKEIIFLQVHYKIESEFLLPLKFLQALKEKLTIETVMSHDRR